MRAGRLVTILMILQRQGRTTAAALAEQLEVSERTILRDLEELSGAGVPVFATRGPGGGYQLLDGFRMELPVPDGSRQRRMGSRPRGLIRISPEGRRLAAVLGSLRPLRIRRTVPADASGWLEATFRIDSMEAVTIDLLALSPHIEVIAPARLRDAVRIRLNAALDLHRPLPSPGTAPHPAPRE